MPSERSTLRRHVPVKGHRGIYWSGTERNKRFDYCETGRGIMLD